MHRSRKRKVDGKETTDDDSEAGPSQQQSLALPARKNPKETLPDSITSLQQGKNDPTFGHYWIRFVDKIPNWTPPSSQKCEAALSDLSEVTSFDEDLLESFELFCGTEMDIPDFPTPSGYDIQHSFENVKKRDECDAGPSFVTSASEVFSDLPSVVEENVESKSESEVSVTPKINDISTDQLVSSPDTKFGDSEEKISQQEVSDKEEKTATTGKTKEFYKTLICGYCDLPFGRSDAFLNKLLYKHIEEMRNKSHLFKCHICSKLVRNNRDTQRHIVGHLRKHQVFCLKCQTSFGQRQALYDLESDGASMQVTLCVETQELEEKMISKTIGRTVAASLSGISVRCKKCNKDFGDIASKFLRLYQYHSRGFDVQTIKHLYCCILCGICRKFKISVEKHLVTHFQSKSVYCQKCYDKLSPEKNPEISETQEFEMPKFVKVKEFNRCLEINCGKCTRYLADSSLLEPEPGRMYELFIDGNKLKVISEDLYSCIICHSKFTALEIVDHIIEHINSGKIRCSRCFDEDSSSVACIEKIPSGIYRTKLEVLCKEYDEFFGEDELQSKYKAFRLRTFLQERNDTGKCIFVCDFCKVPIADKFHALRHIKKHISNKDIFCSLCTNKKCKNLKSQTL